MRFRTVLPRRRLVRIGSVGGNLSEYTQYEPSIQRYAQLGEGLVNRRAQK
jgi:hypothetical protein